MKKLSLLSLCFLLIIKHITLKAQTYQYTNFTGGTVSSAPASSITGTGSFTNPSMGPNFTFPVTSSRAKINEVAYDLTSNKMPNANQWETKYGQVTTSTNGILPLGVVNAPVTQANFGTQQPVVCNMLLDDALTGVQDLSNTPLTTTANYYSTASGSGILGVERDLALTDITGTSSINLVPYAAFGRLGIAQGVSQRSLLTFQWDGIDGNAATLDPTGLGGLNFSILNGIKFDLLKDSGAGLIITLELWSNAGAASTMSITLPSAASSALPVNFDFANLTPLVGSGVDLSSIGAVVIKLDSRTASPGLDYDISAPVLSCGMSISGNVFNDINGLNPTPTNTVDGAGTNAGGLNAILYDNTTGNVVGVAAVSATGAYSFPNVTPGDNYSVYISTTNPAINSTTIPTVVLPLDWVSTGENNCVNTAGCTGSDGTVNGILPLGVVNAPVTQANFGIEQLPNSISSTTTISQPTAGQTVTLNGGANPPFLTGSDPEDQPATGTLATRTVAITSPITNGELRYNGVLITVGQDGVNPPSASNPFVIANFNPDLLTIVMTGSGYTSTQFNFAYVDAAGQIDPTPATYQLNWSSALPVVLLNFTARREESTTSLNWATASEAKSDYFAIERSMNGKTWQKIGEVKAGGDSWQTIYYSFQDNKPMNSENLYRLKMVDKDGTFAYSKIVSLAFQIADQITIFPNPVSDILAITLRDWSKVQNIDMYDTKGKAVYTTHRERTDLQLSSEINVKGFETGIYVVLITLENGTVTSHKIVVSR